MAEGRTAHAREENDWYVEPPAATAFLLERETLPGIVWDPAAGQGNIVQTVRDWPGQCDLVVGSDLVERAPGAAWFMGQLDFLQARWRWHREGSIVTNPPYGRAKLAEAFIRQALGMRMCVKLAVILNSKFLFGAGRAGSLFVDHPPSRIWPINPRPSIPTGQFLQAGGKAEGGVENFAWFVWDRSDRMPSPARTEFRWARPDEPL